jgi:hypothetical protein
MGGVDTGGDLSPLAGCGVGFFRLLFFLRSWFLLFSKSPSAAASGGFLLSNSPEYGGLKGKTLRKKIPRPRSGQGRFFFSKPVGPRS